MLPTLLPRLVLVFGCWLTVPVQAQGDDGPPPPSRERVESTVETLRKALRGKDPAPKIEGLRDAVSVLHPDVIEWVEKALRDKSDEIRAEAIGALGEMRHPESLEALHGFYRREKKLRRENPTLFVTLLKAIASHRSEDSIDLLADGGFETKDRDTTHARILGLGMIRERDSIEALMTMMRRGRRQDVQRNMTYFRMSLMQLGGVDRGSNQEAWVEWWGDNKRDFEMAEQAPLMPKALQTKWDRYWDIERDEERETRRGERGGGPEGGDGGQEAPLGR